MGSQTDNDICHTFNKHSGTASLENSQVDTDALEACFHFNGHGREDLCAQLILFLARVTCEMTREKQASSL